MGQMATTLNTLQSHNSNKLPSQIVLNPRNVSAITLRSEENESTTRKSHANQPSSSVAQQLFSIPLPFPPRINPSKKMGNMEELDMDLLDTFRKIEVKGNERISLGRNVYAMIDMLVPHIPEKCEDSDTFIVSCIIGNRKFEKAMLNLDINVFTQVFEPFK
ncbi:hypothetical protein Lal_00032026 [Lupinus albus]|nr:hypothetical protein Lal_00032026 [Lupinus albus]